MDRIYSGLIPTASTSARESIAKTLKQYVPEPMLRFLAENRTTIRPLRDSERYAHASPALRRLAIDVDAWPALLRTCSSSKSVRCIFARGAS